MGIIKKIVNSITSYFSNDPLVGINEELKFQPLPNPCPPFSISGYTGNPGENGTPERHAMMAYVSITRALSAAQSFLDTKLTNWAATSTLIVSPRAGKSFNAYYDRSSLRFFFDKHPVSQKIVFSVESPDVVCHETGHAILDCLRPDIWNVQALEIFAFHESFGDITSIMTSLFNDKIVNYILDETGGDLRKTNIVSRVAEELGGAIAATSGRTSDSLRNAVNNIKWVPPEAIPPGSQVSAEPHDFSKIFTGAFYDLIVYLYEYFCKSCDKVKAINLARDHAGWLLFNGVRNAQITPRFFDSVVRSMLFVATRNKVTDLGRFINMAFSDRGILQPKMMASFTASTDKKVIIHRHRGGMLMHIGSTKNLNFYEETGMKDNPLYKLDVEAPDNNCIQFDSSGKMLSATNVEDQEISEAVKSSLDFLHEQNKVGEDKEFIIKGNKLLRNHICLCPTPRLLSA